MPNPLLATIETRASRGVVRWLLEVGGIGLIPLAILDNSLIPIPASVDVATIAFAARDRELWFYYAAMATTGSVLGGFLTYRLARKGGQAALEKRFPRKNVRKIQKTFERWGFAAIAIPALLPPPFPLVPFLVAAGGMQYPLTKFLTALTAGRAARYFILAFLGAHYGRHILSLFSHHAYEIIFVTLGFAVAVVIVALFLRAKHHARKPA